MTEHFPLESLARRTEREYGVDVLRTHHYMDNIVELHVYGVLTLSVDLNDDRVSYVFDRAPEVSMYAPYDWEAVAAGVLEAAAREAAARKADPRRTPKHARR